MQGVYESGMGSCMSIYMEVEEQIRHMHAFYICIQYNIIYKYNI